MRLGLAELEELDDKTWKINAKDLKNNYEKVKEISYH